MSNPPELPDKSSGEVFFWTREPEFLPPEQDGGIDTCVEMEFVEAAPSELETLLNSTLEAMTALAQAQAGVIRVLLPDEETLRVISAIGLSREDLEAERFVELACEDCPKDAFMHGLCSTNIPDCEARQGRSHRQLQSIISVPLQSRQAPDSLLGVFTLFFNTPHSNSGPSANLAIALAEMLSGIIEHARASREARRAEMLMERQSIANEIHDSLAQTLNYARMNTTVLRSALQRDDPDMAGQAALDIEEALEIGQKAVRALITDFRSEMDPAGLLHALEYLVREFRKQNQIVLDYTIRVADLDLPLEHEIQCYLIAREALSNIAKHSNASHARLIVDYNFGYYVLTIEDNGAGTFSPVEGHYGIVIMRERAQRIGGEIRVDSTKGLGTSVQLHFPDPESNWRKLHGR